VLTTYPRHVTNVKDQSGNIPYICGIEVLADGMYRNKQAIEMKAPKSKTAFYRTPFWAAGLAFSRGHRVRNVPNDKYLEFIFNGEETDLSMRLFTHGYDLFTPRTIQVWHYYTSNKENKDKGIKKFWSAGDWAFRRKVESRAIRRFLTKMHRADKIAQNAEANNINNQELQKYGLGKKRSLEEWYTLAGLDFQKPVTKERCKTSSDLSHLLHETS